MRRPQFSLKTLLWLMAVVAAFFAGRRSEVNEALRSVRAKLSERGAKVTAREEAVYLDEAKLMKSWHQFKLGTDSLRNARKQLIEMDREQAEKERDDAIVRQALKRLRPSPEPSGT